MLRRGGRRHDKVRVLAADIQDFQPEGLYDVIICNGVLHYIEDKTVGHQLHAAGDLSRRDQRHLAVERLHAGTRMP